MNLTKLAVYFLLFLLIIVNGCKNKSTNPTIPPIPAEPSMPTGLDGINEMSTIGITPKDLSIVILAEENIEIRDRVMLDEFIPPVKSQENYGTCTAWAIGYYARTIMYARENNLTQADLQNPANFFSPKYLFFNTEHKGDNCWGSNPYYAFKSLQENGIATWETVPYTDLGTCLLQSVPEWDQNAANYKIESFRRVEYDNLNALKTYLNQGRPIQVSCNLGNNFFSLKDQVLYEDDYSADPAQHKYHAMCLVGYDDQKGTNGAFKLVNSWGENWGDQGFCWIDYNFFMEKLCYSAYVIEGDKGGLSEPMLDDKVINPNYRVDGQDLITIQFKDEQDPEGNSVRNRVVTYNVFNRGDETIHAHNDWNIVYYYYNAYDPENDFGVVLYDYYTDDVGEQYKGQNDDFNNVDVDMQKYGIFNWWNYVDVPPGWSVAKSVYPDDGYDYDFKFYYEMPQITGEYYLVMMADGFNDFDEQYEQNNYIFFTGNNKSPIKLENGKIVNASPLKGNKNTVNAGELKQSKPNTYSVDEISKLISFQKKNGILQNKIKMYSDRMLKTKSNNRYGKRTVKAELPR